MADFIGQIIGDVVTEFLCWLFKKLPRPVRIGCFSILIAGLAGLLVWVFTLQ